MPPPQLSIYFSEKIMVFIKDFTAVNITTSELAATTQALYVVG
jgi:hypothetical protein